VKLTERQERLVSILRNGGPFTAEQLSKKMEIKKTTLRPDLTFLVRSGILNAKPKVGYFFNGLSAPFFNENYLNLRVGDVMGPVQIIKEKASVYEAVVSLFLQEEDNLFVINDDDYLSGTLSRKDLLKATVGGGDLHIMPVGMVMTRLNHIISVYEEDLLSLAVGKLVEYDLDALPVVRDTENNKRKLTIMGMVNKSIITRLFYDQWQIEDSKRN
jgi:CBS domain-containing protein